VTGVEEFRTEVRAWLEANAATYETGETRDLATGRPFRRALWDAGLLGLTLDPAYGGRGLTSEHQTALAEEVGRYALPPLGEPVTTGICAPTLLDFGTEEQKRRHIPAMLRGDEVWTQLLSEPGAGSDLAALQTKAVRDGDEFVLTGQKVWTSGATDSDYALCVARTDPSLPKHEGLSMFIVDLRAAGVTIRPLRQMTGDQHFNEVFLDEVRVPADALVGNENDGWRALTAMLTHERLALGAGTGAGGSGATWSRAASQRFIDLVHQLGLQDDAVLRQDLARLYTSERLLDLIGQKMRDEIAAGVQVGSKGSVAKLATAVLARQSADLGMRIVGAASQAWPADDPAGAELAYAACMAPMIAIAGGTSEIQRNTIGERVLGLPKEPAVDRGVPFKDILQNPVRSSNS
jgi:alkylation response protein AidB-like acyl-CoA dehydrogenase